MTCPTDSSPTTPAGDASRSASFFISVTGVARLLAIVMLALAVTSAGAYAAKADDTLPSVATLLARAKAAMHPQRASISEVTIITRSPSGESIQWTGRQARKRIEDRPAMLTVLLHPESVAGFAVLVRGGEAESTDEQWVYMPPVRRTRRLVFTGRYEAFLGTDLTYEDLGLWPIDQRSFKLLGIDQVSGVRAYKIREVPVDPAVYSRITTWIAADTYLPLKREYFDRAGLLWRVAEYAPATTIDGVPTSLDVRVKDVQAGGSSELRRTDVQYDVEVPDSLFSSDTLPEADHASVWRESS
jgi:hypothetical protein